MRLIRHSLACCGYKERAAVAAALKLIYHTESEAMALLAGRSWCLHEPMMIPLHRLHLCQDREHFPEGIVFQKTGDKQFIQSRCIIKHPWRRKPKTADAREYLAALPKRLEEEAQTTARLTGWMIVRIREKQAACKDDSKEPKP